jgi:hypothetical protein
MDIKIAIEVGGTLVATPEDVEKNAETIQQVFGFRVGKDV